MIIAPGTVSLSVVIGVFDDTGLPVPGLVAATMPGIYYEIGGNAAQVQIPLHDLGAINDAWYSAAGNYGVFEIGNGRYRLDVPNLIGATAHEAKVFGDAAGKHVLCELISVQYVQANTQQFAGQGVGLDANNRPNVNAADWGGAAVGGMPNSGNVTVAGYVAGQDPGTYVLVTPGQKIVTNAAGQVAIGAMLQAVINAIATEVEAQIIDDTDSERVLQAITDKIAASNPSLAGLTLAAIAAQVRTNLATELARIDVPVSSASTPATVNNARDAVLAQVGTPQQSGVAVTVPATVATQAKQDTIIAKTNLIPATPATEGNVTAVGNAVVAGNGVLATLQAILDRFVGMIENVAGDRFTNHAMSQAPTAGGDPLVNAVPGVYPPGSAGQALGRLQAQVPGNGPVQVIPPPPIDATKCRLYGSTRRPNTPLTFSLEPAHGMKKAGRIMGREDMLKTVVSDPDTGDFFIDLDRNDLITPAGTVWYGRSPALELDTRFTLTTDLQDLGALIPLGVD